MFSAKGWVGNSSPQAEMHTIEKSRRKKPTVLIFLNGLHRESEADCSTLLIVNIMPMYSHVLFPVSRNS